MSRDRVTIQVRVTGDERLRYELAAQAVGLSLSEWARFALRSKAGLWTGDNAMIDPLDSFGEVQQLDVADAPEGGCTELVRYLHASGAGHMRVAMYADAGRACVERGADWDWTDTIGTETHADVARRYLRDEMIP